MSDARKPNGSPPDSPEHVAELIGRRMGWSRAALWIERVAQAFWPLYTFLAGGLAVALLFPFDALPFWLHVAALIGFACGAVAMGIRGFARLSPPTEAEAWAKLDAGSPERPATTLLDRLEAGGDDPATRAIWAEHRRRMAEKARLLRPAPPDLRLSSRDRWALRYAAPLSLLGALFLTAEDGRARLDAAFSPSREVEAATGPALSIEAWATPPIYTGAPPVYLTQRSGEEAAIVLPVGTRIAIQVFDADAEPALTESVGEETAPARFSVEGGRGAAAEITLLRDGAVEVALGKRVAAWRFAATPDQPPTITFTAEPKGDAAGLLEISFAAADDFGIAAAAARIEPDAEALAHAPSAQPFVTESIILDLPLPLTRQATEAGETVSEDLTRHIWAGLPVTAILTAEDEIGQKGESETARFRLPQRRFYEPMARALIEQRRSLGWDLARARYVHAALSAVTVDPEAVFDDHIAYLATRTAIRRLGYAIEGGRVAEEAEGILDLLWDAAVRIEDGDLSNAAERLRAAQQRLRDALRNNAPDDEIARLMQELREALADFLNQMARQALQNPGSLADLPDGAEIMDQQTLEDMLNQLEDAARGGMRERAEQLLSQLQQMLENLQMAQRGQGQGMQGPGQQALRELQDLIGRQQGLADETYRRDQQQRGQGQQGEGAPQGDGQSGQNGQGQSGRGPRGSGALATEQDQLRQLLDDLRQGLPRGLSEGAGDALDRAAREMGEARSDLLADEPGDAVDDQVDAMEAMREGAEQLGEALRQMAGQSGGEDGSALDGPGDNAADVDPLGRPTASMGPLYGDSVDVPDSDEVTRSRELLEELRRRAGERRRPREELDYIDRLMEQF